ncbi:hypothetical protein ACN28C_23280 [Plantactinospora sp. WMMC1484]|uniref:hypothetical protein n=1 Tax=Plantactinospora sp. WMMC1484 TaxID=3404122 RepID=UPI003BF610DC
MSSRATKSVPGRIDRTESTDPGSGTGTGTAASERPDADGTGSQGTPEAAHTEPDGGRPGAGAKPEGGRAAAVGRPEGGGAGVGPVRKADPAAVATRVRDAVLLVPGVAGLTAGSGIEAATQFPGGKIVGVRLGDPVEVHVEVGPVPIVPVAEQIQAAVRGVLESFGREASVEVIVEDIDLPTPVDTAAGD